MEVINDEYVRSIIFKRERTAHKGNFGKVLVFAGSAGMAGAAVFCGKSALKAGAGLVQFLIPWRSEESPDFNLQTILQTAVPEATCVRYSRETNFNAYTAIAAGPGIGQGKTSSRILQKILRTYEGTLVLDADALNIIAKKNLANMVKASKAEVIITPHIGEAKRLLGTDKKIKTEEERIDAARSLTKMYGCITVLKGAGTLVTRFDETENFEIYKNTTGNPGMASGGSGDILTGIIASLAAQGYAPTGAARAGVFIHGLAGDICEKEIGEIGMISSDICAAVPRALKIYC